MPKPKKDKPSRHLRWQDAWLGATLAVLRRRFKNKAEPPTEAKLKLVWRLWKKCKPSLCPKVEFDGDEFSSEERIQILTHHDSDVRSAYRDFFLALKQRFPNVLPLDERDYDSTFEAAQQWTDFQAHIRTTKKLHLELIERQWAFEDAGAQAHSLIAVWRAARELNITRPGLLRKKAPTLDDIRCLTERVEAYRRARLKAYEHLFELCWELPKEIKERYRGKALSEWWRIKSVPGAPLDLPFHLFVARLDELRICGPELLEVFRKSHFKILIESELKANDEWRERYRQMRREFYEVSLKPVKGKVSYFPFRIWFVDNTAVFKQFQWRPQDVLDHAGKLGLQRPKSISELSESLNRWRVLFTFHLGNWPPYIQAGTQRFKPEQALELSTKLISPSPCFSEALPKKKRA